MDVPVTPTLPEGINGVRGTTAQPESVSAQRLEQIVRQLAELQARTSQLPTATNGARAVAEPSHVPHQMTWRARRLLLRGREQLEQLRALGTHLNAACDDDRLGSLYVHTVALAEFALRSVQAFPDRAADQLSLCNGLEAALDAVENRLIALREIVRRRQADADRVENLSELLGEVVRGQSPPLNRFRDLAETIAGDVRMTTSIRWHEAHVDRPIRWAAAHCLNVSHVAARIAADADRLETILAALLHDVGMATLSCDTLGRPGRLTDDQQRQVEHHVRIGTDAVRKIAPRDGWLADAVHTHHERLDGTGYPDGAQGLSIPRIARLLAICDVYAALATPRPHRQAHSPRAALTQTLLEAERGKLDAELAERLLTLTFYPVGSVVELATGQLALVAASERDGAPTAPVRPVLQLLTNAQGHMLPWPEHVDLARCDGPHIVRSLAPAEARTLLGTRCWQLL